MTCKEAVKTNSRKVFETELGTELGRGQTPPTKSQYHGDILWVRFPEADEGIIIPSLLFA